MEGKLFSSTERMTSSTENQYLRPEDLPITDAKKNPLALLAMTCSNIGADILGAGKPLAGLNFERNKRMRTEQDSRSDTSSSDKLQANSIDSNRSNSRGSSDGRLNGSSTHHPKKEESSSRKISFKPYEDIPKNVTDMNGHGKSLSPHRKGQSSPASKSSSKSSPNESSSSLSSSSDRNKNSPSSSASQRHPRSPQPSPHSSSTPSSSSNALTTSSLLPGGHGKGSVCRDPYCTAGCSVTPGGIPPGMMSQLTGSACCPAYPYCIHQVPSYASFYASSLAASRLAGAASFSRPFLCHWTGGGSYCGKSFPTCDELLQHLKSHTLSSSPASSYPGLSPYPSSPFDSYPPNLNAFRSSLAGFDYLRHHPYKLNNHHLGSHLRPNPASFLPHTFPQPSPAVTPSPSMTVFHPSQLSAASRRNR